MERDVVLWLESQLGTIIEIAALPGWRPAWSATAKTSSQMIDVHIRADRAQGQEAQPLRQEYDALRLLEGENTPVPHIHGWCHRPAAIIMDQIDAVAFAGGADKDPAPHDLLEDYMALMDRIDVDKRMVA